MKKAWLSLIVVAIVASLACTRHGGDDPLGSSNGNNGAGGGSSGPTATPTPLPVVNIFTGAALGTWFGKTLFAETGSNNNFDPSTGQLSQIACSNPPVCTVYPSIGWIKFTVCSPIGCVTGPAIPSGYMVAGKIEFDLHIDNAQALIGGMQVYWGNPACYFQTSMVQAAALAGCFGAGNFGHFSFFLHDIPLSFACQTPFGMTVPLQVSLSHLNTDTQPLVFVIKNVVWD